MVSFRQDLGMDVVAASAHSMRLVLRSLLAGVLVWLDQEIAMVMLFALLLNLGPIDWKTPAIVFPIDQAGDDISTAIAIHNGAVEGAPFAKRNGPVVTSAYNISSEYLADIGLQFASNKLANASSKPIAWFGRHKVLAWAWRSFITYRFANVTVHNFQVAQHPHGR
jgi:hypothetical protein